MRRVLFAIMAGIISLGALLVPATSASAGTMKTITVKVGDQNCRYNGRYDGGVAAILLDAIPGKNPRATWINGRTKTFKVIYTGTGSKVQIKGQILCKNGWWPGRYQTLIAGLWISRTSAVNWSI